MPRYCELGGDCGAHRNETGEARELQDTRDLDFERNSLIGKRMESSQASNGRELWVVARTLALTVSPQG